MKATKKRITGNLKLLGLLAIALCMATVTGCKKHEIVEPNSRHQCTEGEDKNESTAHKRKAYSTNPSDDESGTGLKPSSDDRFPPDNTIPDRNGDGDDGDGDGDSGSITDKDGEDGDGDGDSGPITDKDGDDGDGDGDGENNRITDKDGQDFDKDGESPKSSGN